MRRQAGSLVELEVANARALVGGLFGLFDGLLKLFFQKAGLVLFRVHSLAEEGLLAAFLLAHGLGGRIEIAEHLRLDGCDMRDYRAGGRIHLQRRATAGTGNLKGLW